MDRLIRAFDLKATPDDAPRTFEGYGSVFGVEDSYRDIIAPGAFTRSLREWAAKGRMPALLWQHEADQPVGVWEVMREDATGLFVRGRLSDTQAGRDAYTLLKDGALSGLSIGFMARAFALNQETGVRTLTDIDLWEVSVVTFPANDPARITSVKSAAELPSERDFEDALRRDAGLSRAEAKRVVSTVYRPLLCDAAASQSPSDIAGRHVDGHEHAHAIEVLQSLRSVLRAGVQAHDESGIRPAR